MSASKDTLISPDQLKQPAKMPQRGHDRADIGDLEEERRRNIRGEVRFDAGSKAIYAYTTFRN